MTRSSCDDQDRKVRWVVDADTAGGPRTGERVRRCSAHDAHRCAALASALQNDGLIISPSDCPLGQRLGSGCSAQVYLGNHNGLDVAVKWFHTLTLRQLLGNEHMGKMTTCPSIKSTCQPQIVALGNDVQGASGNGRHRRRRSLSRNGKADSSRFCATSGAEHGPEAERKRSGGSATDEEEKVLHFAREFSTLLELAHPNVLELRGLMVAAPQDPVALVTEFCPGGSLADALHKVEVDLCWDQKQQILLQASRGIAYLHSRDPPIVHRDLKPDNIFLKMPVHGPQDEILVKVADFGFCRDVDAAEASKMTVNMGTICYMAPELIHGNGTYDQSADIYSIGVVMFETISRVIPYMDVVDIRSLQKDIVDGLRPAMGPKDLPTDCPEALKNLMESCWTGNPLKRPTAAYVSLTLEEMVSGEDVSTASEALSPITPNRSTTQTTVKRILLLL